MQSLGLSFKLYTKIKKTLLKLTETVIKTKTEIKQPTRKFYLLDAALLPPYTTTIRSSAMAYFVPGSLSFETVLWIVS